MATRACAASGLVVPVLYLLFLVSGVPFLDLLITVCRLLRVEASIQGCQEDAVGCSSRRNWKWKSEICAGGAF